MRRVPSHPASHRFAAIVPVGPTSLDLWRAVQVVKSLLTWEPDLAWCLFVEDAPAPRGLSDLSLTAPTCQFVVLPNRWRECDGGWVGGLTAGILTALWWIHDHTDADFVLRIDADALAIAPFAEAIRAHLVSRPDAGVIGTVGLSCNPDVRSQQDLRKESKVLKAYKSWPASPPADVLTSERPLPIPGFAQPVTVPERRAFDRLRPHVADAIHGGFGDSAYCQGGACVIARLMIDRVTEAGYPTKADAWAALRVPDDVVLAMYARAVGLALGDCSGPGEPFGVQHRGLPYSPAELVARGHALIHSVKNDPVHSEAVIRQFFDTRAARATHPAIAAGVVAGSMGRTRA